MRARKQRPWHRDDKPAAQMTQEEVLHSILRKLAAVMDRWRECPSRACRRARRCANPSLPCTKLPPRRVVTPENDAAIRAYLYKRLKRRAAELAPPQAAPLASGPAPLHGAPDAHSRRQRSRPAGGQRGGARL